MGPGMLYLVKVNLALALLYATYRLLFTKDTFFGLRRFMLLAIIMLAMSHPFLEIPLDFQAGGSARQVAHAYSLLSLEVPVTPEVRSGLDWMALSRRAVGLALFLGWGYFTLRLAWRICLLLRLAWRCERDTIGGTRVCSLPAPSAPFSFLRWIFIYPPAHTKEETMEILAHERAHVSRWHSVDVLLGELTCAFCWFNPAAWLLLREMRDNLEYLADRQALREGVDRRHYQYHLLGLSLKNKAAAHLYNNFSVLSLKKRIGMMNKRRTKEIGRLKGLVFIPVVAALLLFNCMDGKEGTGVSARVADTGEVNGDSIYTQVDVMPEFPGGINAILDYINTHIQYPPEAIKQGLEGRVICSFVIDKNGSVGRVKVEQGVAPSLDREASHVVASMPRWIPGKHKGQAVACRYVLPIQFKLGEAPIAIKDKNGVYKNPEVMPEFPGGTIALLEFIAKNIRYPESAKASGIEGRVICSFVVGKDGQTRDVKLVRSLDPALDKEAMRVLSEQPRWTPGRHKGESVACLFTVPVSFRIK